MFAVSGHIAWSSLSNQLLNVFAASTLDSSKIKLSKQLMLLHTADGLEDSFSDVSLAMYYGMAAS